MIALFALGWIVLSFGFLLGWTACRWVVDLERSENTEAEADVLPFPERPDA